MLAITTEYSRACAAVARGIVATTAPIARSRTFLNDARHELNISRSFNLPMEHWCHRNTKRFDQKPTLVPRDKRSEVDAATKGQRGSAVQAKAVVGVGAPAGQRRMKLELA